MGKFSVSYRGLCLLLFRQVHLQRFVADGRNRCAGYGPDALELVTLATLADGVVLVAFFLSFPACQTACFGPHKRSGAACLGFGARWRAHRGRVVAGRFYCVFSGGFPNLSELLRPFASRPRRVVPRFGRSRRYPVIIKSMIMAVMKPYL